MPTIDFGTDVSGITDLQGRVSFVSGLTNLGMALARRLMTPRGSCSWDLNCGYDVRALLNSGNTPAQLFAIQHEIERECEKDPRVRTCSAVFSYNSQTQNATISLAITTAAGPFSLVLLATQLTVELLNANT